MSLNFSIDSILRHGNVESTDSTLLAGPGKLGQTSFLDESTSAFLKKQQLNYLTGSNATSNGGFTANGLTANSSNPLIGDTAGYSLLQSHMVYLNKTAAPNSLGVIADAVPNGTGSGNLFGFELGQLGQLGQLNPLELSRLNQLSQLNQLNQLNRFQYLFKINSLYGDAGGASPATTATANRQSTGSDDQSHPNSSNSHSFNHFNHQSTNHLHPATENSTATAFLNLANGSLQAQSASSFNASPCSPMSDESSETMLLNYEDSSDSNRLSQHSGNNMSINSNNSTSNPKQSANNLNSSKNGSSKSKGKDFPLCQKCKLHGIHNLVKGHKKNCPWKDHDCDLCFLTDTSKFLRGKGSKKAVDILSKAGGSPALTAASSLRSNSHLPPTAASSSAALSSALSQPLAGLHPAHHQLSTFGGLLEKQSALNNYKQIVIQLLKERLAQDGLNYEQELRKLKITVIYILFNRFDKNELLKRLTELTNPCASALHPET